MDWSHKRSRQVFLLGASIYIMMTLLFIEHEDYAIYYTYHWRRFLSGIIDYTYPIGFLAYFSPFYALGEKIPKLVFVLSYVLTTWQLHEHLFKNDEFLLIINEV